jgi:hypothetical protein
MDRYEAKDLTSGRPKVTGGTHRANVVLLGQYSAANFHINSDGTGGMMHDGDRSEARRRSSWVHLGRAAWERGGIKDVFSQRMPPKCVAFFDGAGISGSLDCRIGACRFNCA